VDRLEIVYVAQMAVRRPVGRDHVAVISPGEPFHVTGPASDWLQNWYLVRETGVAIVGPPAAEVIAPVSRAAFLGALRAYLDYLRGTDSLGYAVLSACRGVRTLKTGRPCSKQEGALWARERMPEWAWLIDAALTDRLSPGQTGFDDPRARAAARRFVELLVDESGSAPTP
jgi:hypothetical protein